MLVSKEKPTRVWFCQIRVLATIAITRQWAFVWAINTSPATCHFGWSDGSGIYNWSQSVTDFFVLSPHPLLHLTSLFLLKVHSFFYCLFFFFSLIFKLSASFVNLWFSGINGDQVKHMYFNLNASWNSEYLLLTWFLPLFTTQALCFKGICATLTVEGRISLTWDSALIVWFSSLIYSMLFTD